jgi:S1-C subfamily serine protease/phage FluMu protein Com
MQTIILRCSSCGQTINLPAQAKGMRVHCPKCKQDLVVPSQLPPKNPPHQRNRLAEHDTPNRRFPRWLIPTLATLNIVLLASNFLAANYSRPSTRGEASPPLISNATQPNLAVESASPSSPPPKDSDTANLSAEEIYRKYAPATVSIVADDRRNEYLGSGFFVSKNGHLLTNYHVIENARNIHVYTEDGSHLRAQIIDIWQAMDLALLRVQGSSFSTIPMADSDSVAIGSSVVAIGTPQDIGLAQSITQGIISGRRTVAGVPCFQTSTLINHGNSGGPLLNMRGEVVGVATFVMGTAMVTPQGNIGSDIQGINFASEINLAKQILDRNGIQNR